MSDNKELNNEVAMPVVVVDPERVSTQPVDNVLQNNLKVSPTESVSPTNPLNLPGDKVADDMTNDPEDLDDAPFSTDVRDLQTKISVLLSILSDILSELDTDEEVPACDCEDPNMGCNPSMSCLPGCMSANKKEALEKATAAYKDSFNRLKSKYGKELASSDKDSTENSKK